MEEPLAIQSEDRSNQQGTNEQLSPLQKLIAKTDGQGKYQKRSFAIFAIMWFLTAWLLLGMNFFFDDSFTCNDEKYSDPDECSAYVCSLPSQDRPAAIKDHAPSIIFQFDIYLICSDQQNTVAVLQDMMFVGAIFGFFVIPFIADNFGRKLGMRIAWGIGTLSVLLTCISTSSDMIAIGLFLVGFGTNPAITLCFSFINEVCLGKSRQQFGAGVQVAWAIGETTIALVFLTGLSWKTIMFVLFILFALGSLSVQFVLLQTPMFLLKKKPKEAIEILNKMARINGKEELEEQDMSGLDCDEDKLDLHPQQKSLGFTDLFRFKSIRMTSISAAMIFFGIQVIYYSSTLNESSVGFTKTINQIIFGISETLGYISAEFIIHKTKRKRATLIGMGLSFSFCLLLGVMVLFQNQSNENIFKWFETIVLMFARFILCCFWSIFYVYVAELYPTQVRSIGFGWTSVVGMIGSAISPFVKTIAASINMNSWFPPGIFGIVAWLFAFCLAETFGQPLKDTIEQRIQVLIKEKQDLDQDYPDIEDLTDITEDAQLKHVSSTIISDDFLTKGNFSKRLSMHD